MVTGKPVVNPELVRERDRQRVKELALVLLCILAIGGGLLSYTAIRLELLRVGYEIDTLQQRLVQLNQHQKNLELEEAFLRSPSQIWRRAASELGMELVDLDRMVILEKP